MTRRLRIAPIDRRASALDGLLIPLSAGAVVISAIWFAERVLDFKLLPV